MNTINYKEFQYSQKNINNYIKKKKVNCNNNSKLAQLSKVKESNKQKKSINIK